jgi:hypothetical protein
MSPVDFDRISTTAEERKARQVSGIEKRLRTLEAREIPTIPAIPSDLSGEWQTIATFGPQYILLDSGPTEWYFVKSVPNMGVAGFAGYTSQPDMFWLDSADYPAVTGKTLKLRVRGWVTTNATDPNFDVAFALKRVTTAGAADVQTFTFAAAAATATVTNANLGTSDQEKADSASIAHPTNGLYTVTATPSALLANNATVEFGAAIQRRWEV